MTTTKRPWKALITQIRTIVVAVRGVRSMRQRGFENLNALIERGTGDDLMRHILLLATADAGADETQHWMGVNWLLKKNFEWMRDFQLHEGKALGRKQIFTDAVLGLLDQGFPSSLLLANPRSSLGWLLCEPLIYQRLIDGMSVAELSGRQSGNAHGPITWYQFMEPVARRYQDSDKQVDVLLDIVVRLRAKGVEVSAKLLSIELGTQPCNTYGYGGVVCEALDKVDVEIRRREVAALHEAADQTMAEVSEAPTPRARRRL
jgi:hypothetical protein